MRQHLLLNQSRLETAEAISQEIEDYCDATEEFTRDAKEQPGFVAPVSKGAIPSGQGRKGGDGKAKGKGKLHKGLGFQPE